jgi:hypothetical protein
LLIGSGSKKVTRDYAILLNLSSRKINNLEHWPRFYNVIRQKLKPEEELNIEGLAQVQDHLVLLNRGNVNTGNAIFITSANAAF